MNKTAPSERAVLGAIIEANGEPLPPHVQRLLYASPDSFTDPSHAAIAATVKRLRADGRGHTPALVLSAMKDAPEGTAILLARLPDDALPMSAAEVEASTLVVDFEQRKDAADIKHAADIITADPSKARSVKANLRATWHAQECDNRTGSKLTVRQPDDLLAMTFDDSDIILGDRLLATGQPLVIAAAGGAGKSRLLLQLAACVTTGRRFLTFETSNTDLPWLILQTENSNRRLQRDLANLRAWLGDDWPAFNDRVRIHTLETDADGFLSLDNEANRQAIADTIEDHAPGIVAVDPLNEFAIGDLNTDADMRATVSALSQLVRRGNPHRALVVLHHSLTGKAGASRAVGFDRSSFGRNSKALFAWTRGQMNLAPVDPDDNGRLIVACGKASNGREFQPFAVRMTDGGIYECDPTVDVAEWQRDMTGTTAPLMTPERVAELCASPMAKADLSKVIIADCGCSRATSYRHIKQAESRRAIRFNSKHEHYHRT
jgi:hypothetical protein